MPGGTPGHPKGCPFYCRDGWDGKELPTPRRCSIRNFSYVFPFQYTAMPRSLRHTLRIVFVMMYIPLMISLGMIHTDDFCATGDGHLIVGIQHTPAQGVSSDSGICLACLFTAGHISERSVCLPTLAFVQYTVSFPLPPAQSAYRGTQTARAPPGPPFHNSSDSARPDA
jgi:hypothetical protein